MRHELFVSHMQMSQDMNELSHVSHTNNCLWDTNNSCLIYKWATSHTWTSHVTHTQTWALAKLCLYFELSHFSHTNHLCLTCKWATSHTWTSQVPHMNKPCPTHEQVKSHIYRHERRQNQQTRSVRPAGKQKQFIFSKNFLQIKNVECGTQIFL